MGIWSAKIFGLWKLPHCDRCQVQLSDSCPGFCPIGFPIKYQFREKNSIPLLKPLSLPPSPGWINWYQESQEATHASLPLCSGSPTLSRLSLLPCHCYSGRRSLFTNLSPSISKPLTIYILLQEIQKRKKGTRLFNTSFKKNQQRISRNVWEQLKGKGVFDLSTKWTIIHIVHILRYYRPSLWAPARWQLLFHFWM